jgi:hypothetical protein
MRFRRNSRGSVAATGGRPRFGWWCCSGWSRFAEKNRVAALFALVSEDVHGDDLGEREDDEDNEGYNQDGEKGLREQQEESRHEGSQDRDKNCEQYVDDRRQGKLSGVAGTCLGCSMLNWHAADPESF